MKIDHPTPELTEQLRALWKTAFGDSEEFLDSFFAAGFSPQRCMCVTVEDQVAAALYWFDVSCREQPMAYLYAIATAPAYREQGYCHALMHHTHAHLKSLGYCGTILVPDGDTLFRMYGGLGYESCTTISEFVCSVGDEPAPMHRIDRDEYARRRRSLLPEGGVIQEGVGLAFLDEQAEFHAGLGFLLASRLEGDTLTGLELLGNAASAPGILLSLGAAYGTFRTPGEDGKPFAMFLPLKEGIQPPTYFGFAFD